MGPGLACLSIGLRCYAETPALTMFARSETMMSQSTFVLGIVGKRPQQHGAQMHTWHILKANETNNDLAFRLLWLTLSHPEMILGQKVPNGTVSQGGMSVAEYTLFSTSLMH